MGVEGVGTVEVGAHAGNNAHASFFGCGEALPEEISVVKKFPVSMELHLGGIEGEDAGDADEAHVGAGGVPVVSPFLDVHDDGVMLGHVALADTANLLLPRLCG